MMFELETWGDGTTRLVHWDALHGEDMIFILFENGSALRASGDDLEPVNLVSTLQGLAQEREAGQQ